MDIVAIREAIINLENEETTPNNVSELAHLYTVYNQLSQNPENTGEDELSDIFPYYRKYLDTKRRYQQNKAIDSEVIQGIKDVCRELKEFIDVLYYNTDMNKERLCIRKLIADLFKQYQE